MKTSDAWQLWIAQGFGVGRIRVAPGTWGSILGIAWTAVLLGTGSPGAAAAGLLGGFILSVWLSGDAERRLQTQDPPSVVIDEIAALPLVFAPWTARVWHLMGHLPGPAELLNAGHGTVVVLGFALFRLFDIWKPWPVRQSQRLPGGWGVTVDDFLAAAYAAAALELGQSLA